MRYVTIFTLLLLLSACDEGPPPKIRSGCDYAGYMSLYQANLSLYSTYVALNQQGVGLMYLSLANAYLAEAQKCVVKD